MFGNSCVLLREVCELQKCDSMYLIMWSYILKMLFNIVAVFSIV